MDKADVALAISLLSVALTVTLFRLSGSRLRVRLIPGALDSTGTLLTGSPTARGLDINGRGIGPWYVETATIEVTNTGRTAVTVPDVSLDFGRVGRGRGRHTVAGHPIAAHRASAENFGRLDAGDSMTVMFDFWTLVSDVRLKRQGRLRVRGSVQPAGRRRRLSAWRHRWRVEPGMNALWTSEVPGPQLRAYRELWRMTRLSAEPFQIDLAWTFVNEKLTDLSTAQTIQADVALGLGVRSPLVGFSVLRAFKGEQ